MKNKAFEIALQELLENEGGYVFDKDDPGGETYAGITRRDYGSWEGWAIIDKIKQNKGYNELLERHEELQKFVKDFYYKEYWKKLRCDDINSELIAFELFDTAVNMGIPRAVEFLQRSVNLLNRNGKLYADITIDGIIGEETLKGIENCISANGETLLYNVLNGYQMGHYIRLMELNKKNEKYIGWFKRVEIRRLR